jgi:hypothetical protein
VGHGTCHLVPFGGNAKRKTKTSPQPLQSWVPVTLTVLEKSEALEIQVGKCIIPIDAKTDLNFLAGVLKAMV